MTIELHIEPMLETPGIEGMPTTRDPSNRRMPHNSMNAKNGTDASHSRDFNNLTLVLVARAGKKLPII
jgi:hypothetical protein